MIIKNEKCIVSNSECNYVSTCRYLSDRFGVLKCEHNAMRRAYINETHKHELQERSKLETWSERKDYLVKEIK